MNELQIKMCDIQGRLFELSGANGYDSVSFIKAFMTSEVAKARRWRNMRKLFAMVDLTSTLA